MSRDPQESRAIAIPSGRLARFTRLGSMTAGVAGNMALKGAGELSRGKRPSLRNLLLTPQNLTRIADQLAQMRGAAMKVGQLVSMDTGDMLPPELSEIMARLRSDAHFMPPAQLKQVLNAQWPKDWLRQFKTFDVRPIAAASIGQVHRAVLRNTQELAIKVQYPGVAKSIDSDVANVGGLIRMSGLLPKGFELAPYLEEARQQLHEETDYALEGEHLSRFASLLEKDERFEIPQLVPEWTTGSILAMTFIAAAPIEDVQNTSQSTRDAVATALIDLMFRELFEFGLMQTDPNFANYRYSSDTGKIVLLDFGATRCIPDQISSQYRALMAAGLQGDTERMRQLSLDIGFFNLDTADAHQARILHMMTTVFDALLENETYDFAKSDLPQRMQKEGMLLAEEGFVPPPLPIDVLFLQRKFGGMFLLASRLGARVRLQDILKKYL